MRAHAFPVVWVAEGDEDPAVGQLALRGDRVQLRGMTPGRHPVRCSFGVSDVEAVVVTRRTNPTLHLHLRSRGWIRVAGFSTIGIFEFAGSLSQLS